MNHTLEVRRIAPRRGRLNIPNVGIFLWRLRAYPVTDVPAFRVAAARFRFDPLGIDTPLYTLPQTEGDIAHLADPLNVPLPIGRRPLEAALDSYYGLGKSLRVTVDGTELTTAELRVCNLSDVTGGWAHVPRTTYAVERLYPTTLVAFERHDGVGGDGDELGWWCDRALEGAARL